MHGVMPTFAIHLERLITAAPTGKSVFSFNITFGAMVQDQPGRQVYPLHDRAATGGSNSISAHWTCRRVRPFPDKRHACSQMPSRGLNFLGMQYQRAVSNGGSVKEKIVCSLSHRKSASKASPRVDKPTEHRRAEGQFFLPDSTPPSFVHDTPDPLRFASGFRTPVQCFGKLASDLRDYGIMFGQ